MDRANRARVVERLAHLPRPPLLFALPLQVAASHVQAQRVTKNAVVGAINRNVLAALFKGNHQLHFIVQIGRLGRVRNLGCLACLNRDQRVSWLGEEKRIFTAGKSHFLGVLGVVAAYAIDSANRKFLVASHNRQSNNGRGLKHIVRHSGSSMAKVKIRRHQPPCILTTSGTMSNATMLMILMSGLIAGPAVSL